MQSTCATPDCPRPARHRGVCPKPKPPCVVEGCERDGSPSRAGRCINHHRRWLAHGDVGPAEMRRFAPGTACEIQGCENPAASRGWCGKHYMRFRTHGDPLKVTGRERTEIRTCARCQRGVAETEFRKDNRAPDRLGAYCKPCEKEYNAAYHAANREGHNAKSGLRYRANRERYLAAQRAYRVANIEAVRTHDRLRARGNPKNIERSRRWREANHDRFLALMRSWYRNNRDRQRQYRRMWRVANPDRVREMAANSGAKRSARKRNPQGRIEFINRRTVWKRDKGICGLCALPVPFRDMHLDHFIPLDKGGAHTYENVHTTHSRCNLSKGNREVSKWGFAAIVIPAPRRAPKEGAPLLF